VHPPAFVFALVAPVAYLLGALGHQRRLARHAGSRA
jgi:hypothetical protein